MRAARGARWFLDLRPAESAICQPQQGGQPIPLHQHRLSRRPPTESPVTVIPCGHHQCDPESLKS